jgi:hypothetical protein
VPVFDGASGVWLVSDTAAAITGLGTTTVVSALSESGSTVCAQSTHSICFASR